MRASRRSVHVLLALAFGLVAAVLPAGLAAAEPSPQQIEAEIDKKWRQLEPVIEQYNKVHSDLQKNQKKAKDLQKKIEPLSLKADIALDRIGVIAAQHYKTGPTSELSMLLSGAKSGDLTDQLAMIDLLARHEQAQIADVVAARDKFNTEKAKLDAIVADNKKKDTELAARKKQIAADIKKLENSLPPTRVSVSGCPRITTKTTAEATAVKTACQQVGKPYVFNTAGPSTFDCSGLTLYAWGKAGVSLTHYTGDQWDETYAVSSPRAGDLVFFYSPISHVGLYIGNGQMVHAPRAGKPVQVSSVNQMPITGYRSVKKR
ncbi:NlpC/P60 family protein [Asanoa sp. WMMD1127]|uniref:C40 family peptidase n=1 Tax=Asanoa sp. WMMD1127 TaxID=3016107 RepID=UPI002415FD1E|nr:C40 family peptidase [Asanoa sp. WMMD1127]MDG4822253.1 NlpC/P60 family protein [Asanoa sp. WMMD1127]